MVKFSIRLIAMSNPCEVVFDNLPNFRQAGGKCVVTANQRRVRDGLLFRSSRTDFLNEQEAATFTRLGIKAIIDLRRKSEYERSDGDKILDDDYTPCIVTKGEVKDFKPSKRWGGKMRKRRSQVKTVEVEDTDSSSTCKGKRYLINMMTMDLIWYFFTKVNFFLRYLSLILVLVDWLFGCHYFVRFFYWAVINRQSMATQYVEILEHTKGAIADILSVISDSENLPVLIHCAHGKDRTGLVIAVILSCLGVDDDIIAEDYAESEVSFMTYMERSCYSHTIVNAQSVSIHCLYKSAPFSSS